MSGYLAGETERGWDDVDRGTAQWLSCRRVMGGTDMNKEGVFWLGGMVLLVLGGNIALRRVLAVAA
jgi:hypothetical protein